MRLPIRVSVLVGAVGLLTAPIAVVTPASAVLQQPTQLTAVRAAAHPGYDRLVFQFSGALPTVRSVTWESQVVQDPSGLPLRLPGSAFLQVVVSPATAHTDSGAATYAGSLPRSFDLPVLRQVSKAGDFENVLSFGVGLWQKTSVHLLTLSSPSRLVIDIAVPASGPSRLTETDNGRLVYLRPGQSVTVALSTCVSCGYSWRVTQAPNPAVVRITSSTVVPLPHPAGIVGSPSESRWTPRAIRRGWTSMVLTEYPPGQGVAPAAQYRVRFVVR